MFDILEKDQRPILYVVRCSSDGSDQFGHTTQVELYENFKKQNSIPDEKIILCDEGYVSGSDLSKRTLFSKYLKRVAKGHFSCMIACEPSRFTRSDSAGEREKILVACRYGQCLIGTPYKLYDPHHIDDVFFWEFMQLYSVREKAFILSRTMRGKRKAVESGYAIGATSLRFGYCAQKGAPPKIDEEEAIIVKEAFELASRGVLPYKIAQIFNAKGYPTRYQRKGWKHKKKEDKLVERAWNPSYIWSLLKCEIYTGNEPVLYEFKKPVKETKKLFLPQIIDKVTFDEVQKIMSKNRRDFSNNQKHSYLLRNKLICKRCKNKFYGQVDSKTKRKYYYDSGVRKRRFGITCKQKSVDACVIEECIKDVLISATANPDNIEKNIREEKKDLSKKFKEWDHRVQYLEEQLEKLTIEERNTIKIYKGLDEKRIDFTVLNKELEDIQTKRKEYEKEIIELKQKSETFLKKLPIFESDIEEKSKEITTLLEQADDEKWELYIKLFIDRIEIDWNETTKEYTIETYFTIPILSSTPDTTPLPLVLGLDEVIEIKSKFKGGLNNHVFNRSFRDNKNSFSRGSA